MPAYFAPKISRIFFPTFGRNGPCGAKMGRVWSKPKVPKIRKTELGKVTKFQKTTANSLGVIQNNPCIGGGARLPPGGIGSTLTGDSWNHGKLRARFPGSRKEISREMKEP